MTKPSKKTKRENGDGTLWQRPNGTWVVTVTIPNSKGKRLSRSARSRDLARVKLDELRDLAKRKGSDLAKLAGRPRNSPLTVKAVASAYLKDLESDRSKGEGTRKWYLRFLASFCKFEVKPGRTIGDKPFADLRRDDLKRWIAKHTAPQDNGDPPIWKKSNTTRGAARAVVAMCNWAVKSDSEDLEHIHRSPVHGFEKSPAEARECDLTSEQWKKLLRSQDGDTTMKTDFREAILFMRLTGCRPGEMRLAEKRHFDPTIPAIVYPAAEWKCGKRSKVPKDRIIRLPGEALLIIQKRILKYPTGKLFRGKSEKRWTKDMLSRRFKRLSVRLEIPHLVPYSLRHTFATDMAFRVENPMILADLMGTSVKMLESVYAKVRKRQDLMGQAAAKAIEGIA
jgi:integrase